MEPAMSFDDRTRLDELQVIARRYKQRYGELVGMADVAKAQATMMVRHRRLEQFRKEAARIEGKIKSLTTELARIERWVEFCLEDAIARTKEERGEGWSPQPVLGFRLWGVGPGALHGVKIAWETPTLVATCLASGGDEEIPHSDGRCGRLGCGVYAAKSVESLYEEFGVEAMGDVALGLVALTGKVVEHDAGYRAAEATVVALAATIDGHVLLTTDTEQIEAAFADPAAIKVGDQVEARRQQLAVMEQFVVDESRRFGRWTLASCRE